MIWFYAHLQNQIIENKEEFIMKRAISTLLCTMMVGALFAGCGDSQTSNTDSVTTKAETNSDGGTNLTTENITLKV